jgi:cell wall-associated NlpC family hydrolase
MRGIRLPAAAGVIVLTVLAGAGCASRTVSQPSPFPGVPPRWAANVAPDPRAVAGVIDGALALRGTPYRLGGDQPAAGFDCSGLVRYVFQSQHITLPRTVRDQFRAGVAVDARRLAPGDLIFFDTLSAGPSHVGIALDRYTFVHAPGSGAVVRVDRLDAPYWAARRNGIRRVIGPAPTAVATSAR